jgi:hypothetical protein
MPATRWGRGYALAWRGGGSYGWFSAGKRRTLDGPFNQRKLFSERELNVAEQEKAQTKTDGEQAAQPAQEQAQRAGRVEVTDKNAISLYANFCRVTGTPEELILDFGLNAQPFGVPTEPVEVKQRIVTNYYTAKRMLQALAMSVQRHEQAFGVLETDVQKRVVGGRGRPQAS